MLEYDPNPCYELHPENAAHMTVAIAVITYRQGTLQVLMKEEEDKPFEGKAYLPMSYVRADQRIDQAVRDLFVHELPLGDQEIEQFYTYSCPDRVERTRVMCCAYVGTASPEDFGWMTAHNDLMMVDVELDELDEVRLSTGGLPLVAAYDHANIVREAVLHMREHINSLMLPWNMLPSMFTLNEARQAHEAVLGKELNTQFFRKSVLARKFPDGSELVPTDSYDTSGAHRPARYYYLKRPARRW
jgi:hypothetical protein